MADYCISESYQQLLKEIFLMPIHNAYSNGQQTEQTAQTAGHHPHLADLLRIRQMERLLNHTLDELELVKARVALLEKEAAAQKHAAEFTEHAETARHHEAEITMPPLPISEIKQLAEMAKKFK
jgi:hypothetical protein